MADADTRNDGRRGGWLGGLFQPRPARPAETPALDAPPPDPIGPAISAFVEALPEPTIVLDRSGVIATANGPARATFPTLRTGLPLSFAIRAPELLDAVSAVAAGGAARSVTVFDRVPIERWFEMSVARIAQAGPADIVITVRDLTAQQRLERMRVDFVANASHELRTPLASLTGFIETLQGPAKADPAARERFLEIMRQQAFRMSRLIDDLLSLSRIELAVHVRPATIIDFSGVVAETLDALGPLAGDLGVRVERRLEPGVRVVGDRDELVRVVENLVENALKYGADGGRIEVDLTVSERRQAVFAVRDHGPGIPEEHVPRLTERFYRVDVAQSRDKGGTGLGLAIVKHIVARHRGRLDIESRVGHGSLFRVTVDAAE